MTWDEQAKGRRQDKRQNVGAMVRSVETGERYNIERGGEPVAVVIPYAEYQTLQQAVIEPVCVDCGHLSEEHNYDPSGCAGTACLFAEGGWDELGPVGKVCECEDYNPGGES
jgi:prevent-host-death family protein